MTNRILSAFLLLTQISSLSLLAQTVSKAPEPKLFKLSDGTLYDPLKNDPQSTLEILVQSANPEGAPLMIRKHADSDKYIFIEAFPKNPLKVYEVPASKLNQESLMQAQKSSKDWAEKIRGIASDIRSKNADTLTSLQRQIAAAELNNDTDEVKKLTASLQTLETQINSEFSHALEDAKKNFSFMKYQIEGDGLKISPTGSTLATGIKEYRESKSADPFQFEIDRVLASFEYKGKKIDPKAEDTFETKLEIQDLNAPDLSIVKSGDEFYLLLEDQDSNEEDSVKLFHLSDEYANRDSLKSLVDRIHKNKEEALKVMQSNDEEGLKLATAFQDKEFKLAKERLPALKDIEDGKLSKEQERQIRNEMMRVNSPFEYQAMVQLKLDMKDTLDLSDQMKIAEAAVPLMRKTFLDAKASIPELKGIQDEDLTQEQSLKIRKKLEELETPEVTEARIRQEVLEKNLKELMKTADEATEAQDDTVAVQIKDGNLVFVKGQEIIVKNYTKLLKDTAAQATPVFISQKEALELRAKQARKEFEEIQKFLNESTGSSPGVGGTNQMKFRTLGPSTNSASGPEKEAENLAPQSK